jgi:hypothetical membrane protein
MLLSLKFSSRRQFSPELLIMPPNSEISGNKPRSFLISPQFGALCGIIGPLIGFLLLSIAIIISPWFNWVTNALSDLGHPAMIGGINGIPGINPVAPIFNSSLILTGIAGIIFGIHLTFYFRQNKCLLGLIGGLVFILSMGMLAAVGVFHEGILIPHIIAALVYFVGLVISTLLVGIPLTFRASPRKEGILTSAIGIVVTITTVAWFLDLLPWPGAALPEIMLVISGYIWILVVGIRLYRFGYEM